MHKFFAKTHFIGKNIRFLPECHSTNDILMHQVKLGDAKDGDVLITDFQTKGRGQRGNSWESNPGENLMFSITLRPDFIKAQDQFLLTVIASLALCDTLEFYNIRPAIKWPNDIYVGSKKIAGILIECLLRGTSIENSVVGIGLNVNQDIFSEAHATSMKMEISRMMGREETLSRILISLEKYYKQLRTEPITRLMELYYSRLLGLSQERKFQVKEEQIAGVIKGVDSVGRLEVLIDGKVQKFGLKEIKFLGL